MIRLLTKPNNIQIRTEYNCTVYMQLLLEDNCFEIIDTCDGPRIKRCKSIISFSVDVFYIVCWYFELPYLNFICRQIFWARWSCPCCSRWWWMTRKWRCGNPSSVASESCLDLSATRTNTLRYKTNGFSNHHVHLYVL